MAGLRQHNNIVRYFGCVIDGMRSALVMEYWRATPALSCFNAAASHGCFNVRDHGASLPVHSRELLAAASIAAPSRIRAVTARIFTLCGSFSTSLAPRSLQPRRSSLPRALPRA